MNFGFRILRLAGALALIYLSMVFYLALTERRNAYPRAITHSEANAAIKNTAKTLSCTLSDGTILEGFSIGEMGAPTLLYYPDADEDAAQFLAEVQQIQGVNLVAFNLRGCANNKGTPSAKTFESDAREIADCAAQVNGNRPQFIAGRGTGAILASQQPEKDQKLILIDPVLSLADAISEKYRFLYPKFLVRAKEKMPVERLQGSSKGIVLLYDRKNHSERNHNVKKIIPNIVVEKRENASLQAALKKTIKKLGNVQEP